MWWAMFLSWTAAGLYYLFLACNFKSLRISIAVIKTASDWVADTKRILFVPLGYMCAAIIVFALWLSGMACVSSVSSEPIVADGPGI